MATIRTPSGQRIFPLWNTVALVNAVAENTGATNFGTYIGHSPTAEQAFDSFSTIPMPRSNRVLGDRIAEYILEGKMPSGISVWDYYGVRYIIWRQRINWNDGNGWIPMANRGDDTQNHFDHDHVSVNIIPRPVDIPPPVAVSSGGNTVLILNVKNTGIFMLRGDVVSHLQSPDHVLQWVAAGVPYQDRKEMSREVFSAYTGWEPPRGLMALPGAESEEEEAAQYEAIRAEVQAGMQEIYDEYVRSLQVQE